MKKTILPYNHDALINFEQRLERKGFEPFRGGSFRYTYKRGKAIIKVPHDSSGLRHNVIEAYVYHKFRKTPTPRGVLFAPCKLLSNGCLLMVEVDAVSYKPMPEWADLIDGHQVGLYNGRWVAYDSSVDTGKAIEAEAAEWVDILWEKFISDEYIREMDGITCREAVSLP